MLKDEVLISVAAGKGGDGCCSFRREAFRPRGGPDGGDGGHGGDVVFETDEGMNSLIELTRWRIIKAKDGQQGLGKNCTGKSAEHVTVKVPVGTVFYDQDTGEQLADLSTHGATWRAAKGGKGGRGNQNFASSINQSPVEFEYGEPGEQRKLRVELKIIADAGLVGLPNAGKSTLLSRCSRAKPKIADYPFTTLEPQLGMVEVSGDRFAMADIPGLIEGASEGRGLGHKFLKHVERTRVILHLIDMTAGEAEQLAANYYTIRGELEKFSTELAAKAEIVVGNKVDVPEARARVDELAALIGKKVIPMSGVSGENLDTVMQAAARAIREARARE